MIRNPKSKSKTTRIKVMLCPLPRLVPYNKLSLMLNEINVGALYSVRDHLCHDLETGEQVEGCYRNLSEFLPRLASFYLSTLKVSDIVCLLNHILSRLLLVGSSQIVQSISRHLQMFVAMTSVIVLNPLVQGSRMIGDHGIIKKRISVAKKVQDLKTKLVKSSWQCRTSETK